MATTKLAQILQLTPANEIVFEGPFENVVTSYLELKNPSEQRVCFKVKTTAPRRYCVRPNSGIVEPGSKVKIAIMLQPIELESQSERSKHKFMVQSTVIEDENCNLEIVWRDAPPEKIMDSKLRCVFSTPSTPAPSAPAAATTTTTAEPTSTTSNTTTATPKPTTTATSATTTTTQTTQQQSQVTISEKLPLLTGDAGQNASSRSKETELISRSTPPTSTTRTSSSSAAAAKNQWASNVSNQNPKRSEGFGENSVASSHNLSASFLQPMGDDKKILLVSLVMLFIGVILGKYII